MLRGSKAFITDSAHFTVSVNQCKIAHLHSMHMHMALHLERVYQCKHGY